MQLHQPPLLRQLAELDGYILTVSFAPLPKLEKWVPYFEKYILGASYEEQGLTSPSNFFQRTQFVADPDRTAYYAYGLGRNSVFKVYGFSILKQYGRWISQGKIPSMPSEDTLQRGGDFVIGRDQRISFAYVGRDQSDRPKPEKLIASMK